MEIKTAGNIAIWSIVLGMIFGTIFDPRIMWIALLGVAIFASVVMNRN